MKRLALPAFALALAACSGDSTSIRPGNWETTMRMSAGQDELWSTTVTRCIDAQEAAAPGLGILNASPLGPCHATESTFSNGTISIHASCPGRGPGLQASVPMVPGMMPSRVSLEGRYTATTMEGQFSAELEDTLEPMRFTGTMTGRRTGECGN